MTESISYRGHSIIASAQFNPTTKTWLGRADITYEYNDKEAPHRLIGPNYVHLTERAAEYFMIFAARNWIEARLASMTEYTKSGVGVGHGHI